MPKIYVNPNAFEPPLLRFGSSTLPSCQPTLSNATLNPWMQKVLQPWRMPLPMTNTLALNAESVAQKITP